MGTKRRYPRGKPKPASLAGALFTKVQQRVLGLLFGNAARSFYANEIIALANSGTGAVQRELVRLEQAGLVNVTRVGNQKHYQANPDSPVFEQLRTLILKTSGLADILRAALAGHSAEIRAAFVFGSIARGADTASSDVDVMVISDTLSYADLFAALEEATTQLGRKVNPTVYSQREWHKRLREGNAFARRVLAQSKVWLIGGLGDLAT